MNKIRVEVEETIYKTINDLCHSDLPDDAYALRALIRKIWDDKNDKRIKHMLYSGMVTAKDEISRNEYEKAYAERIGGRLMRKHENSDET